MPRKKKVENEIIKGTEVSTENVSESSTKEMSFEEQYEIAKKALVIKAYNVLVKFENVLDVIMSVTPDTEAIRKIAKIAENFENDEDFKEKLIEAIVGDKGKTE